ncbi:MAG: amidohydrolase family protein [Candidatus Brocadiia bacterium]
MTRPLIDYAREGKPLKDVPVLDVHAHIGGMAGWNPPPLKDQVAEMDRLGIDTAVVSSCLALTGAIQRGNDEVIEAHRRFPDQILGYCHVSGNYPEEMLPELERCFKSGAFVGIKIYDVGCPYDSDLFQPTWEFAREYSFPVLAHTWGGNIESYQRTAEANPDIAFLAAHAGSSFAYKPYIEAACRHENFYLDLTYSREHTNMIEHFAECLGPDQLVWGSDAPCFSMSHQLGKILFARIPDPAKRQILHDNAAKLLAPA